LRGYFLTINPIKNLLRKIDHVCYNFDIGVRKYAPDR